LADWSLLTNHGRLLLAIENEPGLRVRGMADGLELSERGVALILRDLRQAGYVTSRREGRRVFYSVVAEKPTRRDPTAPDGVSCSDSSPPPRLPGARRPRRHRMRGSRRDGLRWSPSSQEESRRKAALRRSSLL